MRPTHPAANDAHFGSMSSCFDNIHNPDMARQVSLSHEHFVWGVFHSGGDEVVFLMREHETTWTQHDVRFIHLDKFVQQYKYEGLYPRV